MHSHVPSHTPGGGEHHVALPTLEHALPFVAAKMVVKAAPRYELLAALETNKWSFPSVTPRVLFQMAAFLEGCRTMLTTVLPLLKLSLAWVVHGVEPWSIL